MQPTRLPTSSPQVPLSFGSMHRSQPAEHSARDHREKEVYQDPALRRGKGKLSVIPMRPGGLLPSLPEARPVWLVAIRCQGVKLSNRTRKLYQ